MKRALALASLVLAAAVAGCNSMTVTQRGLFVDERSNVAEVEYGQLKKERSTDFYMENIGKTLSKTSRLAVRVDLTHRTWPEYTGSFTAYECMNPMTSGTLYKSSNEKWLYHANGTSCSVYVWNKELGRYVQVFNGLVSCGSDRKGGLL